MSNAIISKESEPAKDFISETRGILKGSGFSSEKYIQFKREDKELER